MANYFPMDVLIQVLVLESVELTRGLAQTVEVAAFLVLVLVVLVPSPVFGSSERKQTKSLPSADFLSALGLVLGLVLRQLAEAEERLASKGYPKAVLRRR